MKDNGDDIEQMVDFLISLRARLHNQGDTSVFAEARRQRMRIIDYVRGLENKVADLEEKFS